MDWDFITDEAQRNQAIQAYESSIAELKDNFKLELDDAVNGLKSKNAELLDEKKQLQKSVKQYEDFDFDAAKEAMEFLENNKDAQLIKDGKTEELLEKKTSQLRSDHEAELSEINSVLKEEKSRADKYESLFKTKMVEDSLREAAIAAKVRPEAITDILLHGRTIFSLADDDSVEARDKDGKLRKTEDDKVLTPSNWIESLKKVSPHYWPESVGAGAQGGRYGSDDDIQVALAKAAESGNMAEYRRLRAKQNSLKN
jgi:hypothetical protein